MNLRRCLAAALAFMLGATAASGAEPRIGKLVAYELGHYTIYTTRSASQAQRFASALGKFHVSLEKLLGKRATEVRIPTSIVILSSGEWQKYLQPRQDIAGSFQSSRFSNFIVMNGDAEGPGALHLVFHEYTHYYLASQFAGEYPPWFNEGLAEVMGYANFRKDMAILLIPVDRLREARDGDWIPFDRMIRIDHHSPEYISHKLADSFYAQAWLTVHYGLLENRDFGRQIFQYLNELNRLVPQETASKTAFGDLAAIDQKLRAYSRSSNLHSGGLTLGEVPEVVLPPGKPVAELDALAIVADLMIETRLAPDRIRPVVESLTRRAPDSARFAVLAARLALYDEDQAGFDAALARATSLMPADDWLSRRELASVLLDSALDIRLTTTRNSEDSKRDLSSAMRWFGEAITHNNGDVKALWGYGTAAIRLDKDLDLAEQALLAAYKKAPANADIAMSLASLKGQQQKPAEMIPFLKDTIRFANNRSTRKWAADTLIEAEEYLAERERVDAENRKQREEYEKMRAEYEKKYGKPKKKTG
ncbi:MAG TPA: hypothetical protein VFU13_13045 [Steroidobacteraceae bacterium]|nr:hypothetical protein [Steroidobacteraceae bacterium]